MYTHLRHQGKTYRKHYGTPGSKSGIPNRRDIDERPEAANNRTQVGDWEADTMIGNKHKGALATLDERKSKRRLALPVTRKSAEEITHAVTQTLEPIKETVLSITFDNGKEFAAHEVDDKKPITRKFKGLRNLKYQGPLPCNELSQSTRRLSH